MFGWDNGRKMDHFFDHYFTNFHENTGFYPFSGIFGFSDLSGLRVGGSSGTLDGSNMEKMGKTVVSQCPKVVSQRGSKSVKKWSHRGLQRELRRGEKSKSSRKVVDFVVLVKKW